MSRILFLVVLCACAADNPDFTRSFPPFRIVGNVYYVGTWDLASYLIVTPQGNILINTGVGGSAPQIKSNIETLGFKLSDVKILTATHGHYDHVGDMAEMKRLTRARLFTTTPEVTLLESGGKTDFRFGNERDFWFAPVHVDEKLADGQTISLGGTVLTVHLEPGHTRGAAGFTLDVADGGRTFHVLIANMPSINPGVVLLKNPKYPEIAQDYARTFRDEKAFSPDIWLSSHAGQFHLHEKYKPGDPYRPDRFVDPAGFHAAVEQLEKAYLDQISSERKLL